MSVRKVILLMAIAGLTVACSGPMSSPQRQPATASQDDSGDVESADSTVVVRPAIDPDWPPPYDFLRYGLGRSSLEEALERLPFERIELERTPCFGACPAYKVTLHRDGSATYEGGAHAPREGDFRGSVDPFDYGRLCHLIESLGFVDLEREYSVGAITDLPTVYVRVWSESAGSVSVREYGASGPVTLWAIQMAIDAVTMRIRWEPAE